MGLSEAISRWWAALAFLGGCGSGNGDGPTVADLRNTLGFAELAVVAGDQHVEFFVGEEVLREVAETGRFIPAEDKYYSVIRVPEVLVQAARAGATPVTWSLCAAENDIRLFHNAVSSNYHAPGPDQLENCTPWVQEYEGRMTIEYHSGQPGVYGAVRVGLLENRNLFAGAQMKGWLPSACEGDPSFGSSGMMLGSWLPDPEPDDPTLGDCHPPDEAR